MKKLLQFLPIVFFAIACSVDPEPVDPRDEFVGRFEVEDYYFVLDSYSKYYDIRISKSESDVNTIYIENLYNVGTELVAEVIGSKVLIPLQKVGDFEFEGTGSINVDKYDNVEKLTILYTVQWVNHNTTFIECRADCIRY